jgi:hypothetical protein
MDSRYTIERISMVDSINDPNRQFTCQLDLFDQSGSGNAPLLWLFHIWVFNI